MMENPVSPAAAEIKSRMQRNQKAWKYIRDVTNTNICNLNQIALKDGSAEYTYGLMFREWERYASVFTALGMTASKHSRVGLLGSTSAEAVFALYGLNMVGADVSLVPAYSALFTKKITETIRNEKLTDFIITDDFAQANLINDLLVEQKALGLRNVILLHVPVTGVTVNPMLTAAQEVKYRYLKGLYGPIYMDELLLAYGRQPVAYAPGESSDTAFILHTSGTTSGTGKPVPLSDEAFNAAASGFYQEDRLSLPQEKLITAVIVDLSNAYSIIDQVHVPFAMGATVVMVPGGVLNPWFYKAIPKYGITFLFTISAMFERWMKLPESGGPDFSSLQFAVLGGASVSAADKRRYYEFMRRHGAGEITLLNGYGISELGGACFLSSPDIDDESIGWPLRDINIRLLHEDSGEYLDVKDLPCEGVLYLNGPSVATTSLDGKKVIDFEQIDGKPYICTNDYARMEEDGRLTFLGRANRYFINEAGRRYNAGRVETEISRQAGIESCCVVPVYIKTTHDNIPMLCVKPLEGGDASPDVIRKALRQVFISEKTLEADHIPYRVMIAGELPRNANGKIDLYKISRGEVEGVIFTVEKVQFLDRLTDFRLVPYQEGSADMIKEVFDGISGELKNSVSLSKGSRSSTFSDKTEEKEMKKAKKAVEGLNSLNRMGMQMMKNMLSRTGKFNPAGSQEGSPLAGKLDLQKVTAGMNAMNQKARDMLPDVEGMVKANYSVTQELARLMLPAMKEQMTQMMNGMEQMNQIALDTMQTMFDHNRKVAAQVFDVLEKANGASEKAETPEKEAAPVAAIEKKEEEPVSPEKEEETDPPVKPKRRYTRRKAKESEEAVAEAPMTAGEAGPAEAADPAEGGEPSEGAEAEV